MGITVKPTPEDVARFEKHYEAFNQIQRYTEYEFYQHPSYLGIIGMGKPAVPLLLEKMKTKPDWWFVALRSITQEWPCPSEHDGYLGALTDDWLKWGTANGLIS